LGEPTAVDGVLPTAEEAENRPWWKSGPMPIVVYERFLARNFFRWRYKERKKKQKRKKAKEGEGLWKVPQLRKSIRLPAATSS